MARATVALRNVPQMLTLDAGLHRLQNLGDNDMFVSVVTGTSAPTDMETYFVVPGKSAIDLTAVDGESTWAWSEHGGFVGHVATAGGGDVKPPPPRLITLGTWIGTGRSLLNIDADLFGTGANAVRVNRLDHWSNTPPQVRAAFAKGGVGNFVNPTAQDWEGWWVLLKQDGVERARSSEGSNLGNFYNGLIADVPSLAAGNVFTLEVYSSEPPAA